MADGRMSADLNLYGTLSGPSITDETWSGSLPFYLDDTIPPDCLSLPLFEDNDQWLLNSFSPPVSWATGPTLRNIPTASSEASFIAPCQTVHNTTSDYEQKCSPMQATFPRSAPAQTSPTPMHEITSRGSIMSVSSGGSADSNQSGFSIPSYSSSNGSPVYGRRRSSRRPPSQGFEVNERERRKRERFLERSRVAANKCRKKKKEHAKQLESRCETVSRENKLLESQVDHLRSEILNLKSELLRHSHCGDERIKCHLAKMVKQLSDKTGTTAQSSEEKKESLPPTESPKKEQDMAMDIEDLVQLTAAADGSVTERQKDPG